MGNRSFESEKYLFVDNFAGGGGASTGIEAAIGRSVDIAINHDPDAIAMHKVNHPATKHYCENIWEVDPVDACEGNPVVLAWFSPDCRHFSRAKGGKPVDKNIRGLAWVAIKWAHAVRPKVIMLENVPEIQTWGPLSEDGKPVKDRIGETFEGFILALTTGIPAAHPAYKEMCDALSIGEDSKTALRLRKGLGYEVEYRTLRSCDYGAPTTRTRFYMIARSDGHSITWPEATHAPKDCEAVRQGRKLPYHTAAECIDWSIPGKSIFERDKPLCKNTMKRIAKGLEKFVLDSEKPFLVDDGFVPYLIQYHSERSGNEVRGQRVDEPINTIDTSNRYAIIAPYITTLRNHMIGQRVDTPLGTLSCSGAHHEVVYAYLIKYFSTISAQSVDRPLDTLTTKDRFALITIHGEQYQLRDIYMRFLTPREMSDCTGFPHDYVIDFDCNGKPYSRQKQVARIGNAVTPPVPAALVRANLPEYCKRGERYDLSCLRRRNSRCGYPAPRL